MPIQNLARYHALARGITIQATLERLAAVCDSDAEGAECDRTLREVVPQPETDAAGAPRRGRARRA